MQLSTDQKILGSIFNLPRDFPLMEYSPKVCTDRVLRPLSFFCPVLFSADAPTLCWPQVRGSPVIISMSPYVIQSNFLVCRAVTLKSLVTIEVTPAASSEETRLHALCIFSSPFSVILIKVNIRIRC